MKQRYSNPYIRDVRRSVFNFIGWGLGRYEDPIVRPIPPKNFRYPIPSQTINHDEPKVRWINHCTFLITIDGLNILTDPIWSERCSPLPFLGPRRQHAPALSLDELPPVDVVLISHNHYDHLDEATVRALHKRLPDIRWYIPKGLKGWFTKRGIHHVEELVWWQEKMLDLGGDYPELIISAVPAQHNSGRGLFDVNKSLWIGFVVQSLRKKSKGTKTYYFVGDTAYNPYDFKKIGQAFKDIDLCSCPIGTYSPGPFMRTVHSSPEDAVNIHKEVKAKLSVAMHWKTFKLSTEGLEQPPFDLYQEMTKQKLNPALFIPLEPGEERNW